MILANLTELWHHFSTMGPKVYIGLSEMTEHPAPSWYKLENYPHPGVSGVNTGVALMNLTRMRSQGFVKQIIKVRRQYEYLRPESTGDQFLQNVLFSFSPGNRESIWLSFMRKLSATNCKRHYYQSLSKPFLVNGTSGQITAIANNTRMRQCVVLVARR